MKKLTENGHKIYFYSDCANLRWFKMTWTEELDEASILATKKGIWHILLFYLLCGLASIPTSFLVFSQVCWLFYLVIILWLVKFISKMRKLGYVCFLLPALTHIYFCTQIWHGKYHSTIFISTRHLRIRGKIK